MGKLAGKGWRLAYAALLIALMVIGASMCSAIVKSVVHNAQAPPSLERDVQNLANSLNRGRPVYFNDGSKVERFSAGPGPRLNHYVAMSKPYDPAIREKLDDFRRLWALNICPQRTFRAAMEDGVLLVYHFTYSDGVSLPPISLDKAACRNISVR